MVCFPSTQPVWRFYAHITTFGLSKRQFLLDFYVYKAMHPLNLGQNKDDAKLFLNLFFVDIGDLFFCPGGEVWRLPQCKNKITKEIFSYSHLECIQKHFILPLRLVKIKKRTQTCNLQVQMEYTFSLGCTFCYTRLNPVGYFFVSVLK